MSKTVVALTPEDGRLLQKILAEYRARPQNQPLPNIDPLQHGESSDCYVAAIPEAGLPAATVFTGTLIPGKVICNVYQLSDLGMAGSGELPVPDFSIVVYNTSTTAISQGYRPIIRDKFGDWYATVGSGGSSGIVFRLLENMHLTVGTGGASGYFAEAQVNNYWGTLPTDIDAGTGTQVIVYDQDGLFRHALMGAYGIAILDTTLNVYRVIECESSAGLILVELDEGFTAHYAEGHLLDAVGSQQDTQIPGEPLGTHVVLVVFDQSNFFINSKAGDKLYCLYDNKSDVYIALQGTGPAQWIVISTMNGATGTGGYLDEVLDYGGSELDITEPEEPDIQDPLGLLEDAYHSTTCDAPDGLKAVAFFDSATRQYLVFNVAEHGATQEIEILDPSGPISGTGSSAGFTISLKTKKIDVYKGRILCYKAGRTITKTFAWSPTTDTFVKTVTGGGCDEVSGTTGTAWTGLTVGVS